MHTPTLTWQDDALVIVDQTRLPTEKVLVRLTSADDVFRAIRSMQVRGAPAIGIAAAFGATACRSATADRQVFWSRSTSWQTGLSPPAPRPSTAWALNAAYAEPAPAGPVPELKQLLLAEAQSMIQTQRRVPCHRTPRR